MLKQPLFLVVLALVAVVLACSDAKAQESNGAPPSTSQYELAQHSLVGPSTEIVFGGLFIGAATPTALLAAFMAGPGITLCDDDDAADDRCSARDSRAARTGWGVGLSMAAIGAVLVGHGAHLVREIRVARRTLHLSAATLELDRNHALGGVRISF